MPTEPRSPVSRRKLGMFGGIAVIAALMLVISGIRAREDSSAKLREWTDSQAIPPVAVIFAEAGAR
jgi:membrane fusion protein, multidrug efflux system